MAMADSSCPPPINPSVVLWLAPVLALLSSEVALAQTDNRANAPESPAGSESANDVQSAEPQGDAASAAGRSEVPPVQAAPLPSQQRAPQSTSVPNVTPTAAPARAPSIATATELPEVSVSASKEPPEASEPLGYRATTANLGALGKMSILEAPFSIQVTSSDLIENTQASNGTDALRYNPAVNTTQGSDRSCDYLTIRGFLNRSNTAIDGMRSDYSLGITEDKERIEVLSGLNSFLYGMSSPAGMVNYVLKRPTDDPLLRLTVGNYGGSQAYAHIDAGGPLDRDKKFGYRLNVLGVDNGSTGTAGESRQRYLLSGAADWHFARDSVLSLDASHYHVDHEGMQAFFFTGAITKAPPAPDPARNFGAPYGAYQRTYDTVGAQVSSRLSDVFTIRSGARLSAWQTGRVISMEPVFLDDAGNYYQSMMVYNGHTRKPIAQGYTNLDSTFTTGPLKHKATVGVGLDFIWNQSTSPGNTFYDFPTSTAYNLNSPGYAALPAEISIDGDSSFKTTQRLHRQFAMIADRIGLWRDQLSLIVGASYARIDDEKYDAGGARTSSYAKGALAPNVALWVSPVPYFSSYISYNRGLEEGPLAPASASNANEQLSPYMSDQVELGAKAVLGKMGLNAAVFRISKANAVMATDTRIYSEDGRQVHTGAELSFTGKILDRLTLVGGVTVLKAEITETNTDTLKGKAPQAVPARTGRFYGEYDLPFGVRTLTLTGGLTYTAREWVNDANTIAIPSVVLGDVGLRYRHTLFDKPTTFRVNVNNVTNQHYWASMGMDSLNVGTQRTLAFSATLDF